MTKAIEAVYENGVFKPLKKVQLPEHKKFTIIIQTPDAKQTGHGRALAGLLDIAGDCPDTDLSLHHDNYLYGEGCH